MHLVLLILLSSLWSASGQQMPRFLFSETPKMLLVWNDVWEAGVQNSLVLLNAGNKITIRVRTDGIPPGSGLKRILSCSCPTKSSVDEIDLDSLTTTPSASYCSSDIPFSLKKSASSSDEFELSMSTSSISYINVFIYKVMLYVKAQYSGGTLLSNSLSIWNLDPISAFPADSTTPAGFDRHFLTSTAVTTLTRTNTGTGNFFNFQFLDANLVSTIQAASTPSFFQGKLNLGAILNFDATACASVQYDRSMMFTTYDSKLTASQIDQMKTMVLDRKTGILYYARCSLYRAISQFYTNRGSSSIGLCSSVTFSGDVVPYSKMSDVKTRMSSPGDFSFSGCSDTASKTCMILPNAKQNVTIFTGMDSTQLVCPIICDDQTMVFRFFFNDQQLLPPTSSDWSDWANLGMRISRSSNVVEISGDSSVSQSGVYRCEAGGFSHTYYVSIVSMPMFSGQISGRNAALPTKVFAMQGESLSYSCGVRHSGLASPVSLQPQFFLSSTSGGVVKWNQYNLATFNGFVSSGATQAVSTNVIAVGSGVQMMNVSIPSVPPPQSSFGYNFTHRFVCNVSVSGTDAQGLGMSTYGAQTGTDIIFVPRPTKESFVLDPGNDCANQKCYLGNGATFRFGLNASFVSYLSNIGVDVVFFFRIDNLLLTDIRVLMDGNVSTITSNATSFVYQVLPIKNPAVRTELQKRSTLTPVFNFRYSSISDMGNVNLLKSRYGPPTIALGSMDCRIDPLCFYSTDFDNSDSLSFLSVPLDFHEPVVLAGANLTIMIVVIVVCIAIIIVLIVIVVYYANRPPAKTYNLEAKEIEQGHNPNAEAKDEQFKEYNRQADGSAAHDLGNGEIPMSSAVYQNDGFYESLRNNRRVLGPEHVEIEDSDTV